MVFSFLTQTINQTFAQIFHGLKSRLCIFWIFGCMDDFQMFLGGDCYTQQVRFSFLLRSRAVCKDTRILSASGDLLKSVFKLFKEGLKKNVKKYGLLPNRARVVKNQTAFLKKSFLESI